MTGERDFLVGKRVTVIGLGVEGVDVARYAATHGAAAVSVRDSRPPEALTQAIEQLRGLSIDFALGSEGGSDLGTTEVLFASQSILMNDPRIIEARERGVPVSSMTREFMARCPGPMIGITGSSGKTTTTALVAHMLATEGRPYRVGGNIGIGLLGLLDGIDARTWSVLEISHTQLQLTDRSPHIAAVLNVTPNHLDQFAWDEYVALKRNLVAHATADDYVALNLDDAVATTFAQSTAARILHFTRGSALPGDGACLLEGAIFVRRATVEEMVLPVADIPLRGDHNVENVLAAIAIASAAGVSAPNMAAAVHTFQPVPHRLEAVGDVDGVRYVNDSIATTPERTLAGIRSFEKPLILLLGGKDKDLPKDELAQEALQRASGIVFFGADGALFEAAVEANAAFVAFEDRPATARVITLAEAVRVARDMASPGDVVLLSPAGTSFDAYRDFEERGEEFRRLVRDIARDLAGEDR